MTYTGCEERPQGRKRSNMAKWGNFEIPKYVWDRTGKIRGVTTGGARHCQLEGCSGLRICVRWPKGNNTWPCSRGLTYSGNSARIQ